MKIICALFEQHKKHRLTQGTLLMIVASVLVGMGQNTYLGTYAGKMSWVENRQSVVIDRIITSRLLNNLFNTLSGQHVRPFNSTNVQLHAAVISPCVAGRMYTLLNVFTHRS